MQKKKFFSGTKVCPQPPEGLKLKYRKRGNFEAISDVLMSQNYLNGPQIKYIRPGYNHTVLVGPFVAILGHFWAILEWFLLLEQEARASLEPISQLLSYSKLHEWPQNRCNWPVGAFKGHFGAISEGFWLTEQETGASLEPISKLLEWPQIRCNGPDYEHMELVGGPFAAILGHFWAIFGLFQSDFSYQS